LEHQMASNTEEDSEAYLWVAQRLSFVAPAVLA
jgi:hypothetical protein